MIADIKIPDGSIVRQAEDLVRTESGQWLCPRRRGEVLVGIIGLTSNTAQCLLEGWNHSDWQVARRMVRLCALKRRGGGPNAQDIRSTRTSVMCLGTFGGSIAPGLRLRQNGWAAVQYLGKGNAMQGGCQLPARHDAH
jgi:hypothetical protein